MSILGDLDVGAHHDTQTLIADMNYYGREIEETLAQAGIELLRPARKGEPNRAGTRFLKPLRQVIESERDGWTVVSRRRTRRSSARVSTP